MTPGGLCYIASVSGHVFLSVKFSRQLGLTGREGWEPNSPSGTLDTVPRAHHASSDPQKWPNSNFFKIRRKNNNEYVIRILAWIILIFIEKQ